MNNEVWAASSDIFIVVENDYSLNTNCLFLNKTLRHSKLSDRIKTYTIKSYKKKKEIMSIEDRKKKIDAALGRIEKTFGAGSVIKLGDAPQRDIEVIPTGSLVLDMAIGVGGFPRGRIVEIYGPEMSGKSLITLHAIAEVQKAGGVAAFIDAEYAFNKDWAQKIGVNVDDLYLSQPDSGEDAFNILEILISSESFDIIVVDSVSALVSRKELDGEIGDAHIGLQARMMSQGLRMITSKVSRSNTTVVFINQLRQKIGVMPGMPTETTSGGNALKYFASLRLDIRRIGQLKDADEVFGARTRVKVVKNKVAPPFKVAEFDIIYRAGSEGVSRESDIRDLGVKLGFIKKAGSWFTYKDLNGESAQLGQGGEKTRMFLKENVAVADEIAERIKESLFSGEKSLDEEAATATEV